MEELVVLLFKYGGTAVLAALFIFIFIEDRKDKKEDKINNTQMLKELSKSTDNVAESLNLLRMSTDNNTNEFRQHDDRAIQQFSNINEKLIRIEDKLNK